jgi:predicted Zn-dependent protease
VPAPELAPLDEMVDRLERVVEGSPADSTELAWVEAVRHLESNGKRRRDTFERRERTVFVRVRERGRTGLHRTGAAGLSDLDAAVRQALAHARIRPHAGNGAAPAAGSAAGAAGPAIIPVGSSPLFDPELARLAGPWARDRVHRLVAKGELAWLAWMEGRVAVVGSGGLRRAARATAATLQVSCGRGPGAGSAHAAARSLAGLDLPRVFARARERHASWQAAAPPAGAPPLLLSQEAVARLLDLLSQLTLSALSFHEGRAALRGRLGTRVFHPAITLRDDPLDPRALPFPFDIAGTPAVAVELIARGVARTPAVDAPLGRELGLPVTPHAVSHDEARPDHLALVSGGAGWEELARAAEGGLWIGALDPLESFDPMQLRFRATACGVRRLDGERLGDPLPDLVWEDSLFDVLSRVRAVGSDPVTVARDVLGGTTAPMLVVEPGAPLRTKS